MEEERAITRCFPDFTEQPASKLEPSANKPQSPLAAPANACFDCNICLEFAANPVVTLCGHLYCWPCIFRWLHADASGIHHCPVCKSPISEPSLVPLYGCGLQANPHHLPKDFPERPRNSCKFVRSSAAGYQLSAPPRQGFQIYQNYYTNDQVNRMGVLAFAIIPWAFRNHRYIYSNMNLGAVPADRSQRLRHVFIETWLHQLWVFLFCCAVLCLLFF